MKLRNGKVVSTDALRNCNITIRVESTPQPASSQKQTNVVAVRDTDNNNDIDTYEKNEIYRKCSMRRLSYYIKEYQNAHFTLFNQVAILDKIVKEAIYLIDLLLPKPSHTRFVNMVNYKTNQWLDILLRKKDRFSEHICFKDLVRNFAAKIVLCNIKIKNYYEKCNENHTPNTDIAMEKSARLIGMCY
jgi:hypothetical protein